MDSMGSSKASSRKRHTIGYLSPYSINYLHQRNPWVSAWWSAAFPGLGHIMLCKYAVAAVLVGWEVFINNMCGLNTAIFYSMTGQFEQAKAALDLRWFLLYMPVYIFSIWDSYQRTLHFNELYDVSRKTGFALEVRNIDTFEFNRLLERKPRSVLIWSMVAPGLGYLHINRLPAAVLFVVWFVVLAYYSQALPAIHATLLGDFQSVKSVDVQWFLYIPSLYGFVLYDSYAHAVEYNKLFKMDQAAFLRNNYHSAKFRMPI